MVNDSLVVPLNDGSEVAGIPEEEAGRSCQGITEEEAGRSPQLRPLRTLEKVLDSFVYQVFVLLWLLCVIAFSISIVFWRFRNDLVLSYAIDVVAIFLLLLETKVSSSKRSKYPISVTSIVLVSFTILLVTEGFLVVGCGLKLDPRLRLVLTSSYCLSLLYFAWVRHSSAQAALRRHVSADRRRYVDGKWDLDMTYITPRILATSWPSTGFEQWYRNSATQVVKFLNTKHEAKYVIYNLCSEREYHTSLNGRFHKVQRFPMDDHNPGDIELIQDFCRSARSWLDDDPENVVVVHCKGGKGRTGTMVASLLIWIGEAQDPRSALSMFGRVRSTAGAKVFQGVESPSQNRYVQYLWASTLEAARKPLPVRINSLCQTSIPRFCKTRDKLWFAVTNGSEGKLLYISAPNIDWSKYSCSHCAECVEPSEHQDSDLKTEFVPSEDDNFCVDHAVCDVPVLQGNVKFSFYYGTTNKKPVWYFWFNTSFLDKVGTPVCGKQHYALNLTRENIDVAHKNKGKNFAPTFAIAITFVDA